MSETPGSVDLAELEQLGQQRDPVNRDRLVRDVAALTLVGLGGAGLVTTFFLLAPLAGLAALSIAVAACGLALARG